MPDLDTPITTTEALQEQINAALADRLQRERSKFSDYEDLKAFKAGADQALTTATARIGELETQVQDLSGAVGMKSAEAERVRVASAKGVPERWITGDTKEEMEATADAWLADAKPGRAPVVPLSGTKPAAAAGSAYEVDREAGLAEAQKRFGPKP